MTKLIYTENEINNLKKEGNVIVELVYCSVNDIVYNKITKTNNYYFRVTFAYDKQKVDAVKTLQKDKRVYNSSNSSWDVDSSVSFTELQKAFKDFNIVVIPTVAYSYNRISTFLSQHKNDIDNFNIYIEADTAKKFKEYSLSDDITIDNYYNETRVINKIIA